MPFKEVPTDAQGRMDTEVPEQCLLRSTSHRCSNTWYHGLGKVDPLDDIIALKEVFVSNSCRCGLRRLSKSVNQKKHSDILKRCHTPTPSLSTCTSMGFNSSCGSILLKDPAEGRFYKHDSPYTYFTAGNYIWVKSLLSVLGQVTLRLHYGQPWKFPLAKDGGLQNDFKQPSCSQRVAQRLRARILESRSWTDICIFSTKGTSSTEISIQNRAFFDRKANEGIHLALLKVQREQWPGPAMGQWRARSCEKRIMKPEHNDPAFWACLFD